MDADSREPAIEQDLAPGVEGAPRRRFFPDARDCRRVDTRMRLPSLCYHDVVAGAQCDSSGFPGADSAYYKLDALTFQRHLEVIEETVQAHRSARRPGNVSDLLGGTGRRQGCLLTFDDGGSSAVTTIAPMLEDFGWRGHFFIATDYIDAQGFLTRQEIRELRRRGHVIGAHSCSHRGRTSVLPAERLVLEWGISKEVLSGLLGEPVTTAAVPSGYYSHSAVDAAAIVGLKALFTLEPTTRVETRSGCLVLGRYLIRRSAPARLAGNLAVGSIYPCARQWLLWKIGRMAESALGDVYPRVRRAYFSWERGAGQSCRHARS
jgi:peptidoglycan/xylan/chitin deacetylase (PgdA/CDA1 family)